MRFIDRLKTAYRSLTTTGNPDEWFYGALGATRTDSGARVSEETSLRVAAVLSCVRVLSESIASLPFNLYRRGPDGRRELARDHPLFPLLHDQPNEEMTSFHFREVLQVHLSLWGNGYAQIIRDNTGQVVALWPLSPSQTMPRRTEAGKIVYDVFTNGERKTLKYDQVLHIPGLSFDGLVGLSPIGLAKQNIGLALAAEKFGARFFGSGTNPGGIIRHEKNISKEAQERLKAQITDQAKGADKSHNWLLLEEGMDVKATTIPPEHAQFIETRKFQVSEIARIFRVPPHMIGDLEKATFSNIEQQSIDFVTHTLRPWLVRWEQTINKKLLGGDVYAEFNVEGLLRGDTESRYKAYAIGRQWGWLSANDIRTLENQNPIPGGDEYLVPLNMGGATENKEGIPNGTGETSV